MIDEWRPSLPQLPFAAITWPPSICPPFSADSLPAGKTSDILPLASSRIFSKNGRALRRQWVYEFDTDSSQRCVTSMVWYNGTVQLESFLLVFDWKSTVFYNRKLCQLPNIHTVRPSRLIQNYTSTYLNQIETITNLESVTPLLSCLLAAWLYVHTVCSILCDNSLRNLWSVPYSKNLWPFSKNFLSNTLISVVLVNEK